MVNPALYVSYLRVSSLCRSAVSRLVLRVSTITKVCRTVRHTFTLVVVHCVWPVISRWLDDVWRPCTASTTPSTLSARTASASSTRARSRNRTISRTVSSALYDSSADVFLLLSATAQQLQGVPWHYRQQQQQFYQKPFTAASVLTCHVAVGQFHGCWRTVDWVLMITLHPRQCVTLTFDLAFCWAKP